MAENHIFKRQNQSDMQPNMPSLWVFLIIVLGILLALVLATSCSMQLVQRRQRVQLQRRIANGEVDLEVLGIKRLNVPQDQIDKMPKYTYTAASDPGAVQQPTKAANTDVRHSTMFAQTTCSICLDDFVENETQVRELPCKHIYHPECVDPFLKDNSSLCPLCKKSALPVGYCPVQVTAVMVRRERLARQMRESRRRAMQIYLNNRLSHLQRPMSSRPDPQSAPQGTAIGATNADVELGPVTRTATEPEGDTPPPEIAAQGIEARRRWRRERLARQHAQEFDQSGVEVQQADERRPWWRRMLGLS